jgi:integrase
VGYGAKVEGAGAHPAYALVGHEHWGQRSFGTRETSGAAHPKESPQENEKEILRAHSQWVADELRALPNNDPGYFLWHRRADSPQLVTAASIPQIYGGWFREVCDAAGMPDGHSHMLRHSFATHHLANNIPIDQVAQWLGHDPAETRKTYEHWIPERDAQSLRAMQTSWARMGLDEVGNPLAKAASVN